MRPLRLPATLLGVACALHAGGGMSAAQTRSGGVIVPVAVGVNAYVAGPALPPSIAPLSVLKSPAAPSPIAAASFPLPLQPPATLLAAPRLGALIARPVPGSISAAEGPVPGPVAAPLRPRLGGRSPAAVRGEGSALLPALDKAVARIESGGRAAEGPELDRVFDFRHGNGSPSGVSETPPYRHFDHLDAPEDSFPSDQDGNPLIVPDRLKPLLPSAFDKKTWTGRVTLHLHSHFSDGTMTPEEVIEAAYKAGIRVAALTDHDTTVGVVRAWKKAQELGLELHPGAELTAQGGVHLSAIDFDIHNPRMIRHLERLRENRWKKAEVILGNLNALEELRRKEIVLTMAEVEAKSKHAEGGTIEIPHIARVLVDKGLIGTVDEAYSKYLKGDAFKGIDKYPNPSVEEVLGVIRAAGGKAILNHPYTVREESGGDREAESFLDPADIEEQDRLIEEILRKGVDGIEVYRPSRARSEEGKRRLDARVAKYLLWVDRFSEPKTLLAGPGSDFHGNDTHLNRLVVWMPKNLAKQLTDALRPAHAAAIASLEAFERRPPAPAALRPARASPAAAAPLASRPSAAVVLSILAALLALAAISWAAIQ